MSCERSIEIAANTKGVCFIRTSRPPTSIIYKNDEVFEVCIKKKKKNNLIILIVIYSTDKYVSLQLLISDWKSQSH